MKAIALIAAGFGAIAGGASLARSRAGATPADVPNPGLDADLPNFGFVPAPPASSTAMPSSMSTSSAGLQLLRAFEKCSLTRYRLGDGGWTIGWGRYYPDGSNLPPERIDQATADLWFLQDVQDRGERWVKAYVSVELTQAQFDALVSMAYNLSPASFRNIADAVNAGDDPESQALRYVRAGTNLEVGLRRRRAAELELYRTDQA